MKLYGLIGNPLTHSFSQIYFQNKFEKEGLSNVDFKLFSLPDLGALKQILIDYSDLKGFSVTIPYKQEIIKYLSEIDEVARLIGAVNSVRIIRKENGVIELKGYNTDIIGFESTIQVLDINFRNIKALVLGSGGASKAVIYVLQKLNIPFLTVSRNSNEEKIAYSDLDKDILKDYRLIINTTPLGMYPDIDTCPPILYEYLTPQHFLIDLTYNPQETLFLKKGRNKGSKTINGMLMLEKQADASWDIWNDRQ